MEVAVDLYTYNWYSRICFKIVWCLLFSFMRLICIWRNSEIWLFKNACCLVAPYLIIKFFSSTFWSNIMQVLLCMLVFSVIWDGGSFGCHFVFPQVWMLLIHLWFLVYSVFFCIVLVLCGGFFMKQLILGF